MKKRKKNLLVESIRGLAVDLRVRGSAAGGEGVRSAPCAVVGRFSLEGRNSVSSVKLEGEGELERDEGAPRSAW